ncbi:MAG: WecB/TagA/CpsF family glycosyltransferase [Sedimentitalea sp.]
MTSRSVLMQEVRERFRKGGGFALATINMDHLVKMRSSSPFSRAYAAQDLVVADGHSIVALARLAKRPLELMPGSDLIEPLCRMAADEQIKVALVGTTQRALEDAARELHAKVENLDIVSCIAPSGRFEPDSPEADAILDKVQAKGARLCFLALGAPKQEIFALRGRERTPDIGFASVGAGLDFLGGHQVRAPRWMRALTLEWLWRALSSPRRLLPRYLRCFAVLPLYVFLALRQRSTAP